MVYEAHSCVMFLPASANRNPLPEIIITTFLLLISITTKVIERIMVHTFDAITS